MNILTRRFNETLERIVGRRQAERVPLRDGITWVSSSPRCHHLGVRHHSGVMTRVYVITQGSSTRCHHTITIDRTALNLVYEFANVFV